MTLLQIRKKFGELKRGGYIPSQRKGPTGVGHTLEKIFGLKESNIAIPDLGGRVELKATRRNASNLLTLFTFNRGVWKLKHKDLIHQYGYLDKNGRRALYSTVWPGKTNQQGLTISAKGVDQTVNLLDRNGVVLASWDIYTLVGKMLSKLDKLLFVVADSRFTDTGSEQFHYNEVYLLKDPTSKSFLQAIDQSKIAIDLRMHLKPKEVVRNHGTGIRIHEIDMPALFQKRERIV